MDMRLIKDEFYEYWVNDKGQLHGEYKRWHDNGKLLAHRFYENDKLHGEAKLWYNNGQLSTHCFYDSDNLHGEYKWWNDNGKLISNKYCSHGDSVRDLIKERVTDEDKIKLTLEHGGKWVCD